MMKRGLSCPVGNTNESEKSSETMMKVLITFPLHSFDIDISILEEFMLIIYQPKNINDDRFDNVDEYSENDADYLSKPLLFTQKSSKNHVILDGIHEISFRLELPKGPYVYLHKQKDRLLLNEEDKITTLGGGRRVNYHTPHGGEISFPRASPLKMSHRHRNYYEQNQVVSTATPVQKSSINQNTNRNNLSQPSVRGKGTL